MTYGPSSLITDTDKAEFYEYTYDCRNRLIKAGNKKDGYTEYSYDAENNRIELKTKDYTKDYVVESASSEYSRVLSETITYTKDETKNNIKYVYGNGLISEYNGNLISNYHFNHLGSTIAITDKDGKVTNRYEYGVYGNLTAKNSDNKEFLYNGEYGVITDENNLYYMRSRYYNPVIKRFINRDIVAGEMTNSKSLNRFAYVQGNPVSYTDPFGLSPSGNCHSFKNLIHSVLDVLGMIPGIGEIFDLANAAMYLVEGNYKMAGLSLLGALPLIGNMVGGIKFAEGCVKLTKAANVISRTLKYASIIGGIAVAGYTAFTAGKDIYQGVKNHDLTLGRVIADVLSIGISAAGIGFGLKELGSNIKDDFGKNFKNISESIQSGDGGIVVEDGIFGGSSTELCVYNPEFAARQLLDKGTVSESSLRSIIPQGTPNTFVPSDTIIEGYKYNFSINGTNIEIKWHYPDLNAATKYPGSNSGNGWTAQIRVGKKLMTQGGRFVKNPKNYTHIPLRGGD